MRAWPCIVAIALLAPTVLAAASLHASTLSIAGSTEITGDAAAVFARAGVDGFSWDVAAPSGEIVRLVSEFTAVDSPLDPAGPYAYQ